MQFSTLIASLIISHVAAAPAPVDWKTVDYSGVDWSKVDYSGIDWRTVNYGGAAPTKTGATKTTLATATATSTASAAPNGPYGLVTIRSGSDLQYSAVYFNQTLRVGGTPPKSFTPSGVNVPVTTSLAVFVGNNAMSLDVVVPGGQQNYVNADGTIGATVPHSGALPSGATISGFTITPGSSSTSLSTLNYNGKRQFLACPVAGVAGEYEIVVSEKTKRTDCTGVDVAGTLNANYQPGWQWA